MYAVIKTGGKQYKASKGQILTLEKLPQAEGETVEFDHVLMVSDGTNVSVGNPIVSGGKVVGKVVEQGRGKKINIIKFRRRKNYLRRQGHRQSFTKVEITEILGGK